MVAGRRGRLRCLSLARRCDPKRRGPGSFFAAFATLGYVACEDASLEAGFEKVAIYLSDGVPTHAARQLQDGAWTSKLGQGFDIRHTLEAIEGPAYGVVSLFLARPVGGRPVSVGQP